MTTNAVGQGGSAERTTGWVGGAKRTTGRVGGAERLVAGWPGSGGVAAWADA